MTNPLLHIIHWPWIDVCYWKDGAGWDTWGSGYQGLYSGGGMSADIGHHMEPRGPSYLRGAIVHEYGDGRDFGYKQT
jgi:hypothetical protein